MTDVHVVLPSGIDDPARPSGGNVYDRRVCTALRDLDWVVHEHLVEGAWPAGGPAAMRALAQSISAVPDDSLLLVDGLIASASAAVLVPAARRIRLLVLVHMPLDIPGEQQVLAAARRIITTSAWARTHLLDDYRLDPRAVHVAEPGTDYAEPALATPGGENLLCVAPVSRHKGHDVLLAALAALQDLTWHCRLVGSVERDAPFAEHIRQQAVRAGIGDRVELCGALTGADLARAYATSDLLVHASRGETFGMVVTEALAHAVPVIATDVGGVPEALGDTREGRPGMLVGVDDPCQLAAALRSWLTDDELRRRLRGAAGLRRQTLPSWESATSRVSRLLAAAR